jgi:hypothetical protein
LLSVARVGANAIEAGYLSGWLDDVAVSFVEVECFGFGVVGFGSETHYYEAGLSAHVLSFVETGIWRLAHWMWDGDLLV